MKNSSVNKNNQRMSFFLSISTLNFEKENQKKFNIYLVANIYNVINIQNLSFK